MNNHSNSMHERRGVMLPPAAFTLILGALVLSILAGCDLSSTTGIRSIAIGEWVQIDEGDTVRLGRSRTFLRFDDVREDSRCPTGVTCIWEGRAVAGFSLLSPAGDAMFTMTIPGLVQTPYEENDVVVAHAYRFQLLEMNPYPEAGQTESPPQYTALIRVERDDSAQE